MENNIHSITSFEALERGSDNLVFHVHAEHIHWRCAMMHHIMLQRRCIKMWPGNNITLRLALNAKLDEFIGRPEARLSRQH